MKILFTIRPKNKDIENNIKKELFNFCLYLKYNRNEFFLDLQNFNFKRGNKKLGIKEFEKFIESIYLNNLNTDKPFLRLKLSNNDIIDFCNVTSTITDSPKLRVCPYSSEFYYKKYVLPKFEDFKISYKRIPLVKFPNYLLEKIKKETGFLNIFDNVKIWGNFYVVEGIKSGSGGKSFLSLVHRERLSSYWIYYNPSYSDYIYDLMCLSYNDDYKISEDFVCPVTSLDYGKGVIIDINNQDLSMIDDKIDYIIINFSNMPLSRITKLKSELDNSIFRDKKIISIIE